MARHVWIIEKQETHDYLEKSIVGLYGTLDKCAKAFAEEVNDELREAADSNIRWSRLTAENLNGHMDKENRNPDEMISQCTDNDWMTAYAIKRITHQIELGYFTSPEKKHLSGLSIAIKNVPQVKINAVKSELQAYDCVNFSISDHDSEYITAYKVEVN